MRERISPEQQSVFRRGLVKLLGINVVSFAFSVINETLIGHSALGFGQASMELTDAGMVGGLEASHRADVRGEHEKASKRRKWLYGLHIGTATLGAVEAMRLIEERAEPSISNIALSGLVGVLNARYIHHALKHQRREAHVKTPDIKMAYEDPIEVIQDELHNIPDAATIYELNQNGTIAIAKTNAVEAGGGVFGALASLGWEQGGAAAAIASSAGVIAIMSGQIIRERHMMHRLNGNGQTMPSSLNESSGLAG